MTPRSHWFRIALAASAFAAACGQALADPPDALGRLFFTPAERAQLEQARHKRTPATPAAAHTTDSPEPVRFDGMVQRSDGRATYWINGRAQSQAVSGLKPGQVRAAGKVFEPYQVLPPPPDTAPATKPKRQPDAPREAAP